MGCKIRIDCEHNTGKLQIAICLEEHNINGYNSYIMKSVNVAELKNNLSAYLDDVENGEQIIVRNRNRPVARIVRVKPSSVNEEERQLILDGELRLPEKEMSRRFLDRMLSWDLPSVSVGSSVDALIADRNHD
jgi:prevent-host-death family protein